jgi:hypothetical protein
MATGNEAETFKFSRGTYAAFLAPKNKWNYGQLLHNIGWTADDDFGTFILDNGTVSTYKLKEVEKGYNRIVKGQDAYSAFKKGLQRRKVLIAKARETIVNRGQEGEKDEADATLDSLMKASQKQFREAFPLKPPKPARPSAPKPLYNIKTCKVAAETGPDAVYPELRNSTHSGWCEGQLKKFNPNNPCPYLVRWATKPYQEVEVTAGELQRLVNNYMFCLIHEIFDGIVGNVLLWPCTHSAGIEIVRYVRVMRYNKDLRLYTLHFRDGLPLHITPEHLDAASTRNEHLLSDRMEVVFDLAAPEFRWVRFTNIHIDHAKHEQVNYKYKKKYGSDFDSDSDTDKNVKSVPSEKTKALPAPVPSVPPTLTPHKPRLQIRLNPPKKMVDVVDAEEDEDSNLRPAATIGIAKDSLTGVEEASVEERDAVLHKSGEARAGSEKNHEQAESAHTPTLGALCADPTSLLNDKLALPSPKMTTDVASSKSPPLEVPLDDPTLLLKATGVLKNANGAGNAAQDVGTVSPSADVHGALRKEGEGESKKITPLEAVSDAPADVHGAGRNEGEAESEKGPPLEALSGESEPGTKTLGVLHNPIVVEEASESVGGAVDGVRPVTAKRNDHNTTDSPCAVVHGVVQNEVEAESTKSPPPNEGEAECTKSPPLQTKPNAITATAGKSTLTLDDMQKYTDVDESGEILNDEDQTENDVNASTPVTALGTGVHEFNMWILPGKRKREYGFPYRFPKKAMLFMRGDFIHAGGCSQVTRFHMEFFPMAEAGWTKTKNPYWANAKQFEKWVEKKNTFLVPDMRTFPFAFPEYSEEDANGFQNISYPCQPDDLDLFPQLKEAHMPRKNTPAMNNLAAEHSATNASHTITKTTSASVTGKANKTR